MTYLRPPRLPGGRSWRRAASALAIAALAALALAITGSGAALASPASPHAAAAVRAAGAPLRSSTPPPVPRSSTPAPPDKKKTGAPGCAGTTTVSAATWMHDLAPCLKYRNLSDIVIPGSHDSATYGLPAADIFGITQDQEIPAQLNGGIREFDIRVEYADPLGSHGWDWYAHHGSGITDEISNWLTLGRIFQEIWTWASAPGHEQEIIMLNLTMDPPGGVDGLDCKWFGNQLDDAMVTPFELQRYLGTTDPGQVTLGQLWSLPDHSGAARVIMDNSACLASFTEPVQWGPFEPPGQTLYSGYYADQCTANGTGNGNQYFGITKPVLAAARGRATIGDGSEPIGLGPPKLGGLYALDIQGTPEADCLLTPHYMIGDEQEVLAALQSAWLTEPSVRQNLNIIAGDYVEVTNLYGDAIIMDEQAPPGPPTITGLTPGDGQVSVAVSDANGGGAPITFYTVTANQWVIVHPQTVTATGPSSPITVTGLTNGDQYVFSVTATSADGTSPRSQPVRILVGVAPKVTGGPAATGIVGRPYSSAFTVTGAPAPTVTLVSGDKPPGLTLGSDGTLIGTPTQAGRYTFTVQASNKLNTADATATITISGSAPAAPAITGVTLGAGQAGVAFSDASPGTDPITSYTVSATDKNHPAAPPVTATGPGSPVTVTGLTNGDPYLFTVTATSAAGTSPPSAAYGPLNVGVAPVILTGPANGTAGQPYSSGFTVTGAPPPAVTQVSGNRPPGLTLGSDGTLTGTPTQAGSYEFTVQAANPVGTYDATVTVVIAPATLGAGPPPAGGRQLPATICTTPAGHHPACAARTLTGTFPPLGTSAAATLLRATETCASGHASAGYRTLTLTGQRPVPAGSYTLILRYGQHAIIVPVTIG